MSQSHSQELKAIASQLKVLYVEDDQAIREQLTQTLGLFFDQVWVGEDGQAGLALFEKHRPDLIISDIQMPRMNGLQMVRAIKGLDDRVPIVFTTAFSDERYFMESIELGVDRYILKPVARERFMDALIAVGRGVLERRQAEAYAKQQIRNRINTASEKTLQEAINLYPNPTLIYGPTGKIRLMNEAFTRLFSARQIEALAESELVLSDLFERREGFLSDLSLIDESDRGRNRVSIWGDHGRKIFMIDSQSLEACTGESPQMVYTLTDVTRLEYERQKGQNLAAYLQDLLKLRRRQIEAPPQPQKSVEPEQSPSAVAKEPPAFDSAAMADTAISEDEREVLRRSHTYKTPASEYVTEVEGTVLDELEEMEEVEKELEELIHTYEDRPEDGTLAELAGRIEAYARTVENLFEFRDLAFALYQLARFLPTLKSAEINTRRLGLLMESLRLDLSSWRRMIFVTQEAQDIHYLDSSLFSSCLQIELDFGPKRDSDEGENELDLF
jgi:CheY-like chemotaxis protein